MRYGSRVKRIEEKIVESSTLLENSHPKKINLMQKSKSTNQEKTLYYCKLYEAETDPNLIVMEAVLADLSRRIFSLNFTAKNRVNVPSEETSQTKIHLLSRAIEFKRGYSLSYSDLTKLNMENQRDLAKLTISMFCFANPDLHAGNWGIDNNRNIVMIDFDNAFPSYSQKLSSEKKKVTGTVAESLLIYYPNLIYSADGLFGIISADDVRQLPIVSDAKPYNHPFAFTQAGRSYKMPLNIHPTFNTLNQDTEYKNWLYYYATKFFLLTNDEHLQIVIKDHSIGDEGADAELLYTIKEHRNKVYNAFLQVEEYRYFVKTLNNDFSLHKQLEIEITESNFEFLNKNGSPKPHKAYRCLDIQKIFDSLENLSVEIKKYEENLTAQSRIESEIKLRMDRIIQKFTILKQLQNALKTEGNKRNTLQQIFKTSQANHEKQMSELTLEQKNGLISFIQCCDMLISEEINPHSQHYQNYTLECYFSQLNSRIKQYYTYLLKWREDHRLLLENQINELFFYHSNLTTSDIKRLWNATKDNQSIILNDIMYRIFSTILWNKIPTEIYEYLYYLCSIGQSIAYIEKYQNSKIAELFTLIVNLLEIANRLPVSRPLLYLFSFNSFNRFSSSSSAMPHIVATKLLDGIKNPTKQIFFMKEELQTAHHLFIEMGAKQNTNVFIDYTAIKDCLSKTLGNQQNNQSFFIWFDNTKTGLKFNCKISQQKCNVTQLGVFSAQATNHSTQVQYQDPEIMMEL